MMWLPATIMALSDAIARPFNGATVFILALLDRLPDFPRVIRASIAAALVWGFLDLLRADRVEAAVAVAIPMALAIKWYFDNEKSGPNDTPGTGM